MGAWISLNQFKIFKNQIKGFLGIGAAPEFLDNLMWKKFTKKMKKEITTNRIIILKQGTYEYPITFQLIKDGRNNKILNKAMILFDRGKFIRNKENYNNLMENFKSYIIDDFYKMSFQNIFHYKNFDLLNFYRNWQEKIKY